MTHTFNKHTVQGITSPEHCDQNASRYRISSQQLFATQTEVIIEHNGENYRLRITSNGKLILTK